MLSYDIPIWAQINATFILAYSWENWRILRSRTVFGTGIGVPITGILVCCTRYQVPGTTYVFPTTWYMVNRTSWNKPTEEQQKQAHMMGMSNEPRTPFTLIDNKEDVPYPAQSRAVGGEEGCHIVGTCDHHMVTTACSEHGE